MHALSEPRPRGNHRIERQMEIITELKKKVSELEMAAVTQLEQLDGPLRDTTDFLDQLCVVQNLLLTERRFRYHPELAPDQEGTTAENARASAIVYLEMVLEGLRIKTGR